MGGVCARRGEVVGLQYVLSIERAPGDAARQCTTRKGLFGELTREGSGVQFYKSSISVRHFVFINKRSYELDLGGC